MKQLIKITVAMLVLFFAVANVNAQTHKHKKTIDVKKTDKNHDGMVFQCPMCADEISDTPGDCPKCGMEMKKVSLTEAQKALNDISNDDAYVPGSETPQEHRMHKKMSSMKMSVKKMDKNHDGMVFQCPMCADEISDMPGDCPKCGMEMKKVSLTEAQKALNDISNDDAYVPGSETPQEHQKHVKKYHNKIKDDNSNDDTYVPSSQKNSKHK